MVPVWAQAMGVGTVERFYSAGRVRAKPPYKSLMGQAKSPVAHVLLATAGNRFFVECLLKMKIKCRVWAWAALTVFPLAGHAAIVQNGSFENPLNTWVNTGFNYMAVASGSSALTGWDVVNASGRGVAWAQSPTNDGYSPSHGSYFVDLSGFGTEAGPDAALTQTLQNLVVGETYTLGIDYWGDAATLKLNGSTLATAGAASNSGWARLTATFQAASSQALLAVGRGGTSGVAFVDNLTVSGREATGGGGASPVPEPASLLLMATGLAALVAHRRRV